MTSKNHRFFEPSKIGPNATINRPLGAHGPFFYKKMTTFSIPFCIHFSIFRKWQKCKISEKYNAKRSFEPSKSIDFRIDFSFNFHVFSKPLPEVIFEGSKRRSMLKRTILEPLLIQADSKSLPVERHFLSKRLSKSKLFRTRHVLEPTWARNGAENAPKRPKDWIL